MRRTDSIAKYPINLTKELKDLLENFKSINGYVRVTDALEFLLNESKSFNEFKEFFKKIPNHNPVSNILPYDVKAGFNAEDLINEFDSPQNEKPTGHQDLQVRNSVQEVDGNSVDNNKEEEKDEI